METIQVGDVISSEVANNQRLRLEGRLVYRRRNIPAWSVALTAATLTFAAAAQTPATTTEPPWPRVAEEPRTDDSMVGSRVDEAANKVTVGEYLDAINIVELEIDKIERRSNRYNIELAEPLVVLGDALVGVGDIPGAFGAYDRALHVTRVNRGLHHPSQVDIVYREAALHAASGDSERANKRHEYAYNLLLRKFGRGDPALLPGLFALADWYLTNYNIFSARALYRHAVYVSTKADDDDDAAMIRALRGVAASYLSERFPPYHDPRTQAVGGSSGPYTSRTRSIGSINSFGNGERALIEVVRMVHAREDATNEDKAAAILELGDWFLMFEKHQRATTLYRRAWELLSTNEPLLAETFHSPTPLYLPLPTGPERSRKAVGEPRNGVVELSLRINEEGAVSEIEMLRSEPDDLMDDEVRRAVRRARYRPAFDGQDSLATAGVLVSHPFVYFATDEPAGSKGVSQSSNETNATQTPVDAIVQARGGQP